MVGESEKGGEKRVDRELMKAAEEKEAVDVANL